MREGAAPWCGSACRDGRCWCLVSTDLALWEPPYGRVSWQSAPVMGPVPFRDSKAGHVRTACGDLTAVTKSSTHGKFPRPRPQPARRTGELGARRRGSGRARPERPGGRSHSCPWLRPAVSAPHGRGHRGPRTQVRPSSSATAVPARFSPHWVAPSAACRATSSSTPGCRIPAGAGCRQLRLRRSSGCGRWRMTGGSRPGRHGGVTPGWFSSCPTRMSGSALSPAVRGFPWRSSRRSTPLFLDGPMPGARICS